ncbi:MULTISPECIES: archaellin/type IV pilin N-terminal domain-containing protein [Haloarcula]|uniref:archaellin/type IV pilin N-terminal domain-containing protein n=1 Tax=Haloarcula TaxID=2237 RepID=UPI0023EDCBE1|nr:archaellin/type IV pilin N-terminal domain-containing protein [Halomicroarcula sp. XH51]
MFTEHNDDDRGQVGIGTLIVFIAMVLVAAIAAGVLINTAGFLQSSAEETGQQSSDQVTNRVEVVNAVGTNIDNGANTVDRAEITVKKAPGAGNIDLGATIVQYVDSSGSYDLTQGGTTTSDASQSAFAVTSIQDEDGSNPVLNDASDRVKIVLDLGEIKSQSTNNAGNGLSEGETATVQINTQSGGTTEVRLVVPETLSGSSAVTL